MARANDFENMPCPHCGHKALRWDFSAGQPRCNNCHLSGFPVEQDAPKPVPQKKKEPKALTNADIEREIRQSNLTDEVTETYTHEHPNGEHGTVVVKRTVPVIPADKIPDLSIDYPTARFAQWRLRELAAQERRWGRDDLRKRGFVKVGRQLDPSTQKACNVLARPGEEDRQGTGRYAIGVAIAVVRRAEQKLRGQGDK